MKSATLASVADIELVKQHFRDVGPEIAIARWADAAIDLASGRRGKIERHKALYLEMSESELLGNDCRPALLFADSLLAMIPADERGDLVSTQSPEMRRR